MSPNLAHVKDLRPETNRLVQQLADTGEYVLALTEEAEELRDKVTTLEGQLAKAGSDNNDMCDQIFELENERDQLQQELKEART